MLRWRLWLGILGGLAGAACGSSGDTDAGDADAAVDAADGEPDVLDDADVVEEAETSSAIELALGEVIELEANADGVFAVELAAPLPEREFGLVLYAGRWATGTFDYGLSATGAAASRPGGSAKTDPRPPGSGAGLPEATGLAGHRRPVADIPALARAVREGSLRIARDPLPTPIAGDRRPFKMDDPAAGVVTIEAECIAVGADIALWMDRTTAGGEDPPVDVRAEVLARYDDTVLPRERQHFGDEPDTSTDGVINVLWSPIVHDIGASAFFSPCDMFDETSLPLGCSYSNEQEILYAMPPSMLPPYMSSPRAILETLAHETQHLIYFHRKVIVGGASGNENAYILEGWASLAEDVTGYGTGLFFLSREALDSTDGFGAIEILRSGTGYSPSRDGMLRSLAWLWTRYLFDRAGGATYETDGAITDGGGIAWARETIDAAWEGTRNLENTCGAPIGDLVFDWYTALLLTGREDAAGDPLPVEARFTYLPAQTDPLTGAPHGFDPYASFMGMFTLNGPVTTTVAAADGSIPATGNELVIIDADGTGAPVSVQVTAPADAELRVRVARLR